MRDAMAASMVKPRNGCWVRFQNKSTRIVLEGFVQQVDEAVNRIRVGKALDSPEHEWHSLADITILKTQEQ